AGILGRFFFSWLSGFIFFAAYAEGSGMPPALYSFCYNGSYIAAEGILTLIIISIPAVSNAISRVKQGILA
ncbi:MAG: energy-coupled thiamine transporter ThiT, partial [Alistipes sp.]|nr:energy-coupled thiamine transporter ThiT [Alistipes sp.]